MICLQPCSFYYYNPLNNGSYSATFLAVQRYAEAEHIPYRHFELDSFWYEQARNIPAALSLPSVP